MEKQKSPNAKTQLDEKEANQVAGGKGEGYCTCASPSFKGVTMVCSKCGKKRNPRALISPDR